jgi:hypothetical protein
LEDYLTKTVYRLLLRNNEMQQQNSSFTLNRSLRSSCNLDTDLDPRYNRTCFPDRVLDEAEPKVGGRPSPNKTMGDATAATVWEGGLGQQNVLLEKRA